MAISEETKIIATRKRGELESRVRSLQNEIKEHQQSIDSCKAQIIEFKKEYDALKKDIPDPTPSPTEI